MRCALDDKEKLVKNYPESGSTFQVVLDHMLDKEQTNDKKMTRNMSNLLALKHCIYSDRLNNNSVGQRNVRVT